MKKYRLDKTYGKAQTIEEADKNREYWLQMSVKERLKAAWYLISCAYGFDLEKPPRLDKMAFSMRKHKS
jgi:hypothetical protein